MIQQSIEANRWHIMFLIQLVKAHILHHGHLPFGEKWQHLNKTEFP